VAVPGILCWRRVRKPHRALARHAKPAGGTRLRGMLLHASPAVVVSKSIGGIKGPRGNGPGTRILGRTAVSFGRIWKCGIYFFLTGTCTVIPFFFSFWLVRWLKKVGQVLGGMEGLTGDPFMRNTSIYVPWCYMVFSCFSLVRGLRAFCVIYLFQFFVLFGLFLPPTQPNEKLKKVVCSFNHTPESTW
jgi:hypothetical protein